MQLETRKQPDWVTRNMPSSLELTNMHCIPRDTSDDNLPISRLRLYTKPAELLRLDRLQGILRKAKWGACCKACLPDCLLQAVLGVGVIQLHGSDAA